MACKNHLQSAAEPTNAACHHIMTSGRRRAWPSSKPRAWHLGTQWAASFCYLLAAQAGIRQTPYASCLPLPAASPYCCCCLQSAALAASVLLLDFQSEQFQGRDTLRLYACVWVCLPRADGPSGYFFVVLGLCNRSSGFTHRGQTTAVQCLTVGTIFDWFRLANSTELLQHGTYPA